MLNIIATVFPASPEARELGMLSAFLACLEAAALRTRLENSVGVRSLMDRR